MKPSVFFARRPRARPVPRVVGGVLLTRAYDAHSFTSSVCVSSLRPHTPIPHTPVAATLHTAAWFALSLLQYPRALDAHVRSSLMVQSHAQQFAALGSARPRLWLLHSRHTARVSLGQSTVIIALVEVLASMGVAYGFIDADAADVGRRITPHTEGDDATTNAHDSAAAAGSTSDAAGINAPLAEGDWLIIPCVSHVAPSTVSAVVRRLADPALRARTLGVVAAAPHDTLLSRDPHGQIYTADASDATTAADVRQISRLLRRVSIEDAPTPALLLRLMEQLLDPDAHAAHAAQQVAGGNDRVGRSECPRATTPCAAAIVLREVVCRDVAVPESVGSAVGVFARSVVEKPPGAPSDGDGIVLLLVANLRDQPVVVAPHVRRLQPCCSSLQPPEAIFDVLRGETIETLLPEADATGSSGSRSLPPAAITASTTSSVTGSHPESERLLLRLQAGEARLVRLAVASDALPTLRPPESPPSPVPSGPPSRPLYQAPHGPPPLSTCVEYIRRHRQALLCGSFSANRSACELHYFVSGRERVRPCIHEGSPPSCHRSTEHLLCEPDDAPPLVAAPQPAPPGSASMVAPPNGVAPTMHNPQEPRAPAWPPPPLPPPPLPPQRACPPSARPSASSAFPASPARPAPPPAPPPAPRPNSLSPSRSALGSSTAMALAPLLVLLSCILMVILPRMCAWQRARWSRPTRMPLRVRLKRFRPLGRRSATTTISEPTGMLHPSSSSTVAQTSAWTELNDAAEAASRQREQPSPPAPLAPS